MVKTGHRRLPVSSVESCSNNGVIDSKRDGESSFTMAECGGAAVALVEGPPVNFRPDLSCTTANRLPRRTRAHIEEGSDNHGDDEEACGEEHSVSVGK